MKPMVCKYSIIRFAPFVETEEFANIGIALVCPELGHFKFRLAEKKSRRVTEFFEPLKLETYKNCIAVLKNELNRIDLLTGGPTSGGKQQSLQFSNKYEIDSLFSELVRERGGAIQFSSPRAIRASNPSDVMDLLFDQYVARSQHMHDSGEVILEKTVKDLLQSNRLVQFFHKEVITDGLYSKSFRFVKKDESGVIERVIKPFYLGYKRPTQLIDHANTWSNAVKRFKMANKLPDHLMFAVEGPDGGGLLDEAFEEAMHILRDTDAEIIMGGNKDKIVEFAKA